MPPARIDGMALSRCSPAPTPPAAPWRTTRRRPPSSGKGRATTTSARTSTPFSTPSRDRRRVRSSTSAAVRGATSGHFATAATSRLASTARVPSSRWRAPPPGVRYCSRTSSLSTCPPRTSTACSRTRRSSTSHRASCFACSASSGARSGRAGSSSRRTHAVRTARDGKVAATPCGTISPAGGDSCSAAAFHRDTSLLLYRPPGRPRSEQPWLASVWRKL